MPPEPANPYVGLRPYRRAERSQFFGRASEIEQIRDLWLSHRLVVVYGASGVGKTSLLNAGVLPAFTEPDAKYRADVLPVGRIPQSSAELLPDPTEPNPYVYRLLSSWRTEANSVAGGESVTAFLQGQPRRTDEDGFVLPLLVAIDQFEQAFGGDSQGSEDLDDFLDQLATATEEIEQLRLLISIRAEQLAPLLRYEARIGSRHRARFEVFPLGRTAAFQAVTGPLADAPRSFAPGVAESLVENLCTITVTSSVGETTTLVRDSVEPVHLQVACYGLWESLPADITEITAANLENYGNVDELLLRFCTAAVEDVAHDFGRQPEDVWVWLARTFLTERGNRSTVSEGIAQIGSMPNEVAQALEARRVLRAEDRLGSRWYELPHDRLLSTVRDGARPWWNPSGKQIDRSAYGFLRQAQAALTEGRQTLVENYALEAARLSGPSDAGVRGEALTLLARTQAGRGNTDDAIAHYRQAIETYLQLENEPAVGRLRAELGRLFYRTGDELKAMDELTIAVRLLPGDLTAKIDLARVFRDLAQFPGALSMLNTALNIAPDHVEALVERGLLHAARGSRRDAESDLRNAIRLDPTVADRDDVRDALAPPHENGL
ncbi:tetratricopeptide repeat protein [Cryptosporangium sp. NPDC048952]|uniref:nSTAND1 domain-containing NTPase n=1 Tax=Cryptosporangium sp. NPDC048952 TaxID=3363961 RepID=UPI00371B7269